MKEPVGRVTNPNKLKSDPLLYIYTMEYYSALTGNEMVPFAEMWMDLESVMWREESQKERNRCRMVSLICGIWKDGTNLLAKQRYSHGCREQAYGCQSGERGWDELGA